MPTNTLAEVGVPRKLVVVWQLPTTREMRAVGVLSFDGELYGFRYLQSAAEIEDFRPLPGFPDLDGDYVATDLFPLFAQRVMDPKRRDFERYVSKLGLDEDSSPWEQISRSGGRREGDTLQLFPVPFRDGDHLRCSFLVHGIRHIWTKPVSPDGREVEVTEDDVEAALSSLVAGDPLGLAHDVGNKWNPAATLVTSDETPLGYVPEILVEDFEALDAAKTGVVSVVTVNPPGSPWHMRLLAEISLPAPDGFEFFASEAWETAAARGENS